MKQTTMRWDPLQLSCPSPLHPLLQLASPLGTVHLMYSGLAAEANIYRLYTSFYVLFYSIYAQSELRLPREIFYIYINEVVTSNQKGASIVLLFKNCTSGSKCRKQCYNSFILFLRIQAKYPSRSQNLSIEKNSHKHFRHASITQQYIRLRRPSSGHLFLLWSFVWFRIMNQHKTGNAYNDKK